MSDKRLIEIFSAGCFLCDETVALVKSIACDSCEVVVYDMKNPGTAAKVKTYGIKRIPAVVIDGNPKALCPGCENDEAALREAGVGVSK